MRVWWSCINGGHTIERRWQIHEINRLQFPIKTSEHTRLIFVFQCYCCVLGTFWTRHLNDKNTNIFSRIIRTIKTYFISKNFIAHSLFHCLRPICVRASWNVQKIHSYSKKRQGRWSYLHIWIQYLWRCKTKDPNATPFVALYNHTPFIHFRETQTKSKHVSVAICSVILCKNYSTV